MQQFTIVAGLASAHDKDSVSARPPPLSAQACLAMAEDTTLAGSFPAILTRGSGQFSSPLPDQEASSRLRLTVHQVSCRDGDRPRPHPCHPAMSRILTIPPSRSSTRGIAAEIKGGDAIIGAEMVMVLDPSAGTTRPILMVRRKTVRGISVCDSKAGGLRATVRVPV